MTETVNVRVKGEKQSATNGQSRHDTRTGKQPNYVDGSKAHLNSIIIHPMSAANLKKLCEERRFANGAKRAMKSNAHIAMTGIITFGKQAQPTINALSKHEQDDLFKDIAESIAKKFDVGLTGLTVHRDESAIHAHFQMPNIHKSGRPLSKMKVMYSELQDEAGKCVNHLDITRGVKKQERIKMGDDPSTYINRSVKELHNDLPKELARSRAHLATANEQLNVVEKQLSKKTTPSRPPVIPKRVEVIQQRHMLGMDTTTQDMYLAHDIHEHFTKEIKKAELLKQKMDNINAIEHKAKALQANVDKLQIKASSMTSNLTQRDNIITDLKTRVDDLERVLHDKGVKQSDLNGEIEKSRNHGRHDGFMDMK
jgi:hypothetical protein